MRPRDDADSLSSASLGWASSVTANNPRHTRDRIRNRREVPGTPRYYDGTLHDPEQGDVISEVRHAGCERPVRFEDRLQTADLCSKPRVGHGPGRRAPGEATADQPPLSADRVMPVPGRREEVFDGLRLGSSGDPIAGWGGLVEKRVQEVSAPYSAPPSVPPMDPLSTPARGAPAGYRSCAHVPHHAPVISISSLPGQAGSELTCQAPPRNRLIR